MEEQHPCQHCHSDAGQAEHRKLQQVSISFCILLHIGSQMATLWTSLWRFLTKHLKNKKKLNVKNESGIVTVMIWTWFMNLTWMEKAHCPNEFCASCTTRKTWHLNTLCKPDEWSIMLAVAGMHGTTGSCSNTVLKAATQKQWRTAWWKSMHQPCTSLPNQIKTERMQMALKTTKSNFTTDTCVCVCTILMCNKISCVLPKICSAWELSSQLTAFALKLKRTKHDNVFQRKQKIDDGKMQSDWQEEWHRQG